MIDDYDRMYLALLRSMDSACEACNMFDLFEQAADRSSARLLPAVAPLFETGREYRDQAVQAFINNLQGLSVRLAIRRGSLDVRDRFVAGYAERMIDGHLNQIGIAGILAASLKPSFNPYAIAPGLKGKGKWAQERIRLQALSYHLPRVITGVESPASPIVRDVLEGFA